MNLKIKYLIGTILTILIICIFSYLILSFNTNENTNDIVIAGSTSVQPVAQALANAYMNKHPNVKITVSGGDSSVGINSVHSGQVNIGTSSRNLTSSESNGLTQYSIGEDAIAIIVNVQNPVNNISTEQLMDIYTGKITNWNQLGGNNATIVPVTREVGSGTRYDFEKIVLGNNSYANNTQVSSSNYAALQTVAVSSNAIGYVARNQLDPEVKLLGVNNISLTQQNVANGEYPMKRQMLFLVKGEPTGVTKDFINFSLSPEGQAIINNTEYNSTSNIIYQGIAGLSGAG
jgi:phosphate transport system substrate-binding protein